MKPFVHPTRTATRLQAPDGSTTAKVWLYRRPSLRLDSSSKAWRSLIANTARGANGPKETPILSENVTDPLSTVRRSRFRTRRERGLGL